MDQIKEVLATYIPKNLDECLQWLDKLVVDKKEVFKASEDRFVGMCHHGLGQKLRNEWELWSGGILAKYFKELGISHPDDMSETILRSFYRKINGKSINLDAQIKKHQEYWKNNL